MTPATHELEREARSFHPSVLEANEHRARLAVMTISRATDLWLGELERHNHSERTVDSYRRLLDKLAGEHPHRDVDELTSTDIRRFLDSQARRKDGIRKAAATIAQNVSVVCGFFDWLTKEGIVRHNPTRRNGDRIVTRPQQPAPEDNDNIVSVSHEDVRRLLRAARGWDERLAIYCLAYLGPRRRAVAQARIRDYDQVDRTLTFREKGGKTISKPVPDDLAVLLDEAINAGNVYHSPDDYLVPSAADQRRKGDRDDRIIWRLVKRVAERAGVETHVHALRAAFAVNYLEQKPGQIVGLQQLMGHRRIETTMVYLRRLNRQAAMETVRDLSWEPRIPANSEELFEVSNGAEKEGFEPSILPLRHGSGPGTQGGTTAPQEQP